MEGNIHGTSSQRGCSPTTRARSYLPAHVHASRHRGTGCTAHMVHGMTIMLHASRSPTLRTALCLEEASAMSAALSGCFSAPPVRQSLLPSHVSGVAASPTNDVPCPGPDDVLYPHLLPQNHGQVLGSRLPGEEARRVRVESLVNHPLSVMLLFCLPQGSLRVVGVRTCGDQRAVAQDV